jgi:hypothetical protein
MTLHLIPQNFLIYEENFVLFVFSVQCCHQTERISIITYLERGAIFRTAKIKTARQTNKNLQVPPDNSSGYYHSRWTVSLGCIHVKHAFEAFLCCFH